MLREEVVSILAARDRAIADKNQKLFLSFQLAEIPNSKSEGYLTLDKLLSYLIAVHLDENDQSQVVAIVKETYWRDGHLSHYGYLLFYLRRQMSGELKISNIAWSNSDLSAA